MTNTLSLRRLSLLMLLAAAPTLASAGTLPGPVVSAAWLQAHASEVTIVDVRDDLDSWTAEPEYEKDAKTGEQKLTATGGHIAGALALEFGKLRVSRTEDGKKIDKLVPDKAYVQDLMQAAGVTKGKPIVITSPGESAEQVDEAARLYWTLKLYGTDQLALLDGGNAGWLGAGLAVNLDQATAARGDWEAGTERRELLAEIPDVEAAAKNKVQLVDARPLPQFLGVSYKKPAVLAGGHLAGAANFPTDVRTRNSGLAVVFLKPDEYRAVLKAQGIAATAPTITYCNTGHLASGAWFVQSEILGNPQVRLYDGSMHEWTTLGHSVVGLGG